MKKRKKKARIIVTGVLAGLVLFFLAGNIYFLQCIEKEDVYKRQFCSREFVCVCKLKSTGTNEP